VTGGDESVVLEVEGRSYALSRAEAAELQAAIGEAITHSREFLRTVGEHREDGRYVVSRRGADSTGNAKVFESFDVLRRLYERLPDAFTADDVGRTGITGSRRHMLVHHFCEHPAFDCGIDRRSPLTASKADEPGDADGSAVGDSSVGDAPVDAESEANAD